MTTYEYQVEVFGPAEYAQGGASVAERLNDLSLEGWRVLTPPIATGVLQGGDRLIYTLERARQQEPEPDSEIDVRML